jgi:molecular chaperone GrpE
MVNRKHRENGNGGEPASGARDRVDVAVEEAVEAATAAESAAEAGQEALPEPDLELELEEARREAASHLDDFLRARAEIDNLRKRAARDVEHAHKYGLERFMNELLPVKDSIELGLNAADGTVADAEKLREGLELTLKLFDAASEKFGLEELNPEGQSFDPEYHQAMSMQEAPDVASGTIVTVVQKGYVLNDRLLRPAMVIVAK